MMDLLKNPHKNFYTTRRKPVNLIVLHVTAGLQDLGMSGADQSAEGTNRYGATTSTKASWHSCVDSDSIETALPDEYTAFHCVNYNGQSLGLEISNTDAQWDNKPFEWIEETLRNAAKVCLAWEKKFDIPRVLRSKAEVDAGLSGYSYHMFLDPKRRRDPGVTYPWDRFVAILDELDGPTPVPTSPDETDGEDLKMRPFLIKDGPNQQYVIYYPDENRFVPASPGEINLISVKFGVPVRQIVPAEREAILAIRKRVMP